MADKMTSFSLPQPQRTATTSDIPQTPRTQLIKSHLEQQNFELMNKLPKKNEEQMRDISTQLQTGLQAFLQQSMENMFNCLALAQTNPASQATTTQPHIVSITPLSAVPAATKLEEPMDAAPSQPPPAIKKGLAHVKGSFTITSQSLQAVKSQMQVPSSAPIQATLIPTSASSMVAPSNIAPVPSICNLLCMAEIPQHILSPILGQKNPQSLVSRQLPLTFHELVQRVREFLSIPDPAAQEHYKPGSVLGHDPLLLL